MNTGTAVTVQGPLQRVALRVALLGAASGSAVGLLLGAIVDGAWWIGAAFAAVGAIVGFVLARAPMRTTARRVERRAPECRNVVITAADVAAGRVRASPEITSLLYDDAARVLRAIDPGTLFPAWRSVAALAVSASVWAIVTFADALPVALQPAAVFAGAPSITSVEVTITPPAYAGGEARTLRDPSRVEALEGSTLRIVVRANAARVGLETLTGSADLAADDRGTLAATITADADGFIAIDARNESGDAAARRLLGLAVVPDAPPRVRITAPGRDLFLDSVRRALEVTVEAQDDIGLASLALRYTRVSGSGEQFTFVDGEVVLDVTRAETGHWTARGSLPLDTLALGPGDVVVYRGVARDNRPGAPPSESDAFLVEVSSPVGAIAGGFAVGDEDDRYGVSQQMVILLSERLAGRRNEIAADDFVRESQTLAAAQRRVRAEFVFMLGGALEDDVGAESGVLDLHEEAHAAADADEAIAGRLRNQNRLDLLRAIRAMARAATALNEGDPSRALPDEREALTMLQRAFSRTRYILRTLTERERIDLGRRLSGSLAAATPDARPAEVASVDAAVIEQRRVLADIATLAGTIELSAEAGAQLTSLAQTLLRLDASSTRLQSVASSLAAATASIAWADTDAARAQLDTASLLLAASLRSSLREAPDDPRPVSERALGGALADVLGGREGSR
jgi:hypothetical protein